MSRAQGFTLIELLIVLSIAGLLAALIGPEVGTIARATAAQEEWLRVGRRVDGLLFEAYATGNGIILRAQGTYLSWESATDRGEEVFDHLFFDDQEVYINANGVADQPRMTLTQRGRARELSLDAWAEVAP